MASTQEYADWIVRNQDKKGTPEFDTVARAYQESKKYRIYENPKAATIAESDQPTSGMSTVDKLRAGAGKAFADVGRGVGQLFGGFSKADIDQAKKLDAPLMDTGAGSVGNVAGNLALVAPTALIPGINTVTGAGLAGGALGAIQPVGSEDSRTKNALLGVAAGAGGQTLAKGAKLAYNFSKAAAEPLTQQGQQAIIGRLMQKAAGGDVEAQAAIAKLSSYTDLIPGSQQTVGQASGNSGLAALERTATATTPEVNVAYGNRMNQQNQARVSLLDTIADPSKRLFFDASRKQAGKQLYDQAFSEAPVDTPWIKGEWSKLEKRPAFQDALKAAETQALNEGVALDINNKTQVSHYAKMALDSAINEAQRKGSNIAGLVDTRDKLVSLIESKDFSPSYREARSTYAAMSKPINEIDTVAAIRDKAVNPLTGNVQPAAYARNLNDSIAQGATGYSGATLQNTVSPDNYNALLALKQDLQAANFAQNAGRGPGSDTIQKLAYSNLIDAAGVPSWLRNMGPAQFSGNVLARGGDLLYGRANREMSNKLAQLMLDPNAAAQVMAAGTPVIPYQSNSLLRLTGPGAIGLTYGQQ